MSAPCHNCPDRFVGCHGVCGKYLAFAEQKKVERNNAHRECSVTGYFSVVSHRKTNAFYKQAIGARCKK